MAERQHLKALRESKPPPGCRLEFHRKSYSSCQFLHGSLISVGLPNLMKTPWPSYNDFNIFMTAVLTLNNDLELSNVTGHLCQIS